MESGVYSSSDFKNVSDQHTDSLPLLVFNVSVPGRNFFIG